eukprot:ANDGO_05797.mRNA.1 hypothetical protein
MSSIRRPESVFEASCLPDRVTMLKDVSSTPVYSVSSGSLKKSVFHDLNHATVWESSSSSKPHHIIAEFPTTINLSIVQICVAESSESSYVPQEISIQVRMSASQEWKTVYQTRAQKYQRIWKANPSSDLPPDLAWGTIDLRKKPVRCKDIRILLTPSGINTRVRQLRIYTPRSSFSAEDLCSPGSFAVSECVEVLGDPDFPDLRHVVCPVGDSVVHAWLRMDQFDVNSIIKEQQVKSAVVPVPVLPNEAAANAVPDAVKQAAPGDDTVAAGSASIVGPSAGSMASKIAVKSMLAPWAEIRSEVSGQREHFALALIGLLKNYTPFTPTVAPVLRNLNVYLEGIPHRASGLLMESGLVPSLVAMLQNSDTPEMRAIAVDLLSNLSVRDARSLSILSLRTVESLRLFEKILRGYYPPRSDDFLAEASEFEVLLYLLDGFLPLVGLYFQAFSADGGSLHARFEFLERVVALLESNARKLRIDADNIEVEVHDRGLLFSDFTERELPPTSAPFSAAAAGSSSAQASASGSIGAGSANVSNSTGASSSNAPEASSSISPSVNPASPGFASLPQMISAAKDRADQGEIYVTELKRVCISFMQRIADDLYQMIDAIHCIDLSGSSHGHACTREGLNRDAVIALFSRFVKVLRFSSSFLSVTYLVEPFKRRMFLWHRLFQSSSISIQSIERALAWITAFCCSPLTFSRSISDTIVKTAETAMVSEWSYNDKLLAQVREFCSCETLQEFCAPKFADLRLLLKRLKLDHVLLNEFVSFLVASFMRSMKDDASVLVSSRVDVFSKYRTVSNGIRICTPALSSLVPQAFQSAFSRLDEAKQLRLVAQILEKRKDEEDLALLQQLELPNGFEYIYACFLARDFLRSPSRFSVGREVDVLKRVGNSERIHAMLERIKDIPNALQEYRGFLLHKMDRGDISPELLRHVSSITDLRSVINDVLFREFDSKSRITKWSDMRWYFASSMQEVTNRSGSPKSGRESNANRNVEPETGVDSYSWLDIVESWERRQETLTKTMVDLMHQHARTDAELVSSGGISIATLVSQIKTTTQDRIGVLDLTNDEIEAVIRMQCEVDGDQVICLVEDPFFDESASDAFANAGGLHNSSSLRGSVLLSLLKKNLAVPQASMTLVEVYHWILSAVRSFSTDRVVLPTAGAPSFFYASSPSASGSKVFGRDSLALGVSPAASVSPASPHYSPAGDDSSDSDEYMEPATAESNTGDATRGRGPAAFGERVFIRDEPVDSRAAVEEATKILHCLSSQTRSYVDSLWDRFVGSEQEVRPDTVTINFLQMLIFDLSVPLNSFFDALRAVVVKEHGPAVAQTEQQNSSASMPITKLSLSTAVVLTALECTRWRPLNHSQSSLSVILYHFLSQVDEAVLTVLTLILRGFSVFRRADVVTVSNEGSKGAGQIRSIDFSGTIRVAFRSTVAGMSSSSSGPTAPPGAAESIDDSTAISAERDQISLALDTRSQNEARHSGTQRGIRLLRLSSDP